MADERYQERVNTRNQILSEGDAQFNALKARYPEAADYIAKRHLELRSKTYLGNPVAKDEWRYTPEQEAGHAKDLVDREVKSTSIGARFKNAATKKAKAETKATTARVRRAGVAGGVVGAAAAVAAPKVFEAVNNAISKPKASTPKPNVPKVPVAKAVSNFQAKSNQQNMSQLLGIKGGKNGK